jgi:uncharacterized protein YndB with AHSA1/START domain
VIPALARLARGLLGLGAITLLADRILASLTPEQRPLSGPVRATVEIAAPMEETWAVLADIPGQPRWMPEMKTVRMVTPGPVDVGSVGEATIRIFGIAVRDEVAITTYEPPRAFGIDHRGLFGGSGLLTLRPGMGGGTTIVEWVEHLVPPWLPHLGWVVARPVIAYLYQRDLFLLCDLVEHGAAAEAA